MARFANHILALSAIAVCFQVVSAMDTNTTANTTSPPLVTTSPTTTAVPATAPTTTRVKTTEKSTEKPSSSLNACSQNQIKYVYTECDTNNGRWKVAVPSKPDTCVIQRPPMPERGTKCSFSCSEGKYLNIETQKCEQCQAGTYSLSGGIRFRSWKTLPSGFSTWGIEDDGISWKASERCKDKIWTAKGDYMESAGDYCKSVIAYSVTLEKEGNISIVYRADDETAFFHVKIANDFCTTSDGGKHHFYLNPEMRWKRTYVPLKRGRNVITIEASYIYDSEDASSSHSKDESDAGSQDAENAGSGLKKDSLKSVQIREIKITGLSYTSECSKCQAGAYSGDGASYCRPCDENTFSKEGADSCTTCGSDEYAVPGSSGCTKRPKCSEKDFYEMWSECDSNGKTRKTVFWIIPKICEGGIKIPPPGEEMDCPPCNPGQFNNGTSCVFCHPDEYSDGQSGCKKCPPSTAPNTGLYFRWWQHVPADLFNFYCNSLTDRSCKVNNGWRQFNTYIETGTGHADGTEVGLIFNVPAFKDAQSTLVLEYQVLCESICTFIIEERKLLNGKRTILKQHGAQMKTKFTHHIHDELGVTFRIKFLKGDESPENAYEFPSDRLRLYALNVTNAINGGADKCTECPLGVGRGKGCIQCEKGSYLENKKCIKCPQGTYLDTKNPFGSTACKKCPFGTKSVEGSSHCYSDCQIFSDDGRRFDFSPLSGSMLRKSGRMFTSHGFPYYRIFNVTICGDGNAISHCINNVTKGEEQKDKNRNGIKAMICRSTIIPSHEKKGNVIAQSMSLGDYLKKITFGDPYEDADFKNQADSSEVVSRTHRTGRALSSLFDDERKLNDTKPMDINLFFKSPRSSSRCGEGYGSIITMRCDPGVGERGYIRTSPACETGTCDGCLYHLFWHSKYACPLCSHTDYQNISSACSEGKVTTHYLWNFPKMCRDGVSLPDSTTRGCSVFERTVLDLKVFVVVFLAMGILLIILIIVLCYRNRRLTYKYSRLMDESHYKDGELPASEQCTLDEGEEEDEIILSRGSARNGRRILDRLKKIGSPKNRDDFSEFETINLTERARRDSSADEL